jgi:hypothetical protein
VEAYRFFVMEGASHHDEFVYDREFRKLSHEYPDVDPVRLQYQPPLGRAQRGLDWTNGSYQPPN